MSKTASAKIKTKLYHIAGFALLTLAFFNTVYAQGGDQILDGIGETGLSARYIFDGNLKDWSRNNLHGTSLSGGVNFVNDARFGKVLSLSGDTDAFINLPDAVLNDLESISLTGWIFLRSKQAGQPVFDFGMNGTKHFYTLTFRNDQTEGLTTTVVSKKNQIKAISLEISALLTKLFRSGLTSPRKHKTHY